MYTWLNLTTYWFEDPLMIVPLIFPIIFEPLKIRRHTEGQRGNVEVLDAVFLLHGQNIPPEPIFAPKLE